MLQNIPKATGELVFGTGEVSRSGRPSNVKEENIGIALTPMVYFG